MVRAISHIAIGVSDMDRALRFYRDALGLAVSMDLDEEFPSLADIPAVRRRAVYLRWAEGNDTSFIVLDERPRDHGPSPRKFYELGVHHYGFWVDDLDPIVARVEQLGERMLAGPLDNDSITYGEAAGRTIRTALLFDPDGNIVQLDQRT